MDFSDIFKEIFNPNETLKEYLNRLHKHNTTMFKVSFKESKGNPYKVITKVGPLTTVTIKGTVELPDIWFRIPNEIKNWIKDQKKVEVYEGLLDRTLTIYSEGTARCHEGDKFSTLVGERIAESRAKYFIYKFFHDLITKIVDYYEKVLYGSPIALSETAEGLVGEIRKYAQLYKREQKHIREILDAYNNGTGN